MSFKDIAYKIFKENMRRYLSYFLSSSFAIMIFFIYSTIIFNRNFNEAVKDTTIQPMMGIAMLILGAFSIFFISYAHTSFIKSRNSEFGLFLSLGMTTKDIGKMIRMENGAIGVLSLGFGLLSGSLFSRLFFMVVMHILDLEGISFYLSINSFLLTGAVFLIIFMIIVGISRSIIKKLEISELLREKRKESVKIGFHPMLGVLGIGLVITSFILLFLHLEERIFPGQHNWMIFFIAIGLIGIYLITSEFGSMVLSFLKRSKSTYYKNLLNITEIHHKYKVNARIIFMTSILSAVVIFFMGTAYSLYAETLKVANEDNPYDLSYIIDYQDSQAVKSKISTLIEQADTPVISEMTVEYLDGVIAKEFNGEQAWQMIPAMSEQSYYHLTGKRIGLKKNEAASMLLTAKPERNQWFTEKELIYKSGDTVQTFTFKGEVNGIPMNINVTRLMVIMNDEDYKTFREKMDSHFIKEDHLLQFENWRNIEELAKGIEELQFPKEQMGNMQNRFLQLKPRPMSRIAYFLNMKQQYGFYLFIMTFIGLLFFVTAGNVLYFKLNNDIEDTKTKYHILSKIGIQAKEMKRIIAKELQLIFYVPFIIGILVGYSYIWIMTVNLSIRTDILLDTSIVALVYFIFQSGYYAMSKRRYVQEVLK